jgi:para-nitrobenzyl esterase
MASVVVTQAGRLEGTQAGELHVFRGIPFAAPPVGAQRFRPPQPVAPWTGTRDATRFGGSAPQRPLQLAFLPGFEVGEQSEDCLYLNVTTPGLDDARRPVLVWIHGGGFAIGSGSQTMYDATHLARRGDVVVVTINYRLGALGFLELSQLLGDEYRGAGNLGIQDQIAALRWVRDNVAAFGGDPGNVTIFGESAGGMSVGTLLGTPSAAGLFRRAIAQSGAAHNAHPPEVAHEVAERTLAALGIPRGEAWRLREVSPAQLLEAQDKVSLEVMGRIAMLPFQPTLDGEVLPERAIDAIRRGLSRDVSVMAGSTRDEWNLFAMMDPNLASLDEAGLVGRLGRWLGDRTGELVETYRKAREGRTKTDPRALFLAIESDRVFRIPGVRLAEAQSAHQPETYSYLYTWESPLFGDMLGACHGVDVPFTFGVVDLPGADRFIGQGPAVSELAQRTMDAWIGFARGGAPGHAGIGEWPRYDTDARATMLLGAECGAESDPFGAERRAWDGLL